METPYYEADGIQIFHGKCEDVLPELAGVNTVVTSPPYNQLDERIPKEGTNLMKGNGWLDKVNKYGYDDTMPENEYEAWQQWVGLALSRCSVPGASFFYNHKVRYRDGVMLHPIDLVRTWCGPAAWHMKQELIWDRTVAIAFNAKMFAPCDERIYWLVNGRDEKPTWNQVAAKWMSVWTMSPMNTDGADHPCPFPIELAHKCIEATTNPDDLVLDPFMGSGTVLRAAKDLGRRGIGIEMREDFCEGAVKRLSQQVFDLGGA